MENTHTKTGKRSYKPRARKPIAERLAAMVDTSAGPDACHPFTGSIVQQSGYGQIGGFHTSTDERAMFKSHVVAWEVANGRSVPDGMVVRHTCHNPLCCNPAHLVEGYPADNYADMVAAGRRRTKKLDKALVLAIAIGGIWRRESNLALSAKHGVSPSAVRNILSGSAHSKITGIPKNVATNKGRDYDALREAMTAHGTAPKARARKSAPAPVQLDLLAG